MLLLQNVSYRHPNRDLLFSDINLSVQENEKIALIGNNGSGKSTLLRIIAGELAPASGYIKMAPGACYYVPQLFGQYNDLGIARALKIADKLHALKAILDGQATEENFTALSNDWTIEERCQNAFAYWQLQDLDLSRKMATLSGGQKTKVMLAGIAIHTPELVLLDEPSNHLDTESRLLLYDFIRSTHKALIIVSHDRQLLNLLSTTCELTRQGLTLYGGNYDFYESQKQVALDALADDIQSKEKDLRKAKEKQRETIERQQKLDARGKAKQEKAGIAKIMMNTLRNKAENSTAKIKDTHTEKIDGIANQLQKLRSASPDIDKMKLGFSDSALHKGKILVTATDINYSYNGSPLWPAPLNFQITSGERIAIKGPNGSGKTTLIKLILGATAPQAVATLGNQAAPQSTATNQSSISATGQPPTAQPAQPTSTQPAPAAGQSTTGSIFRAPIHSVYIDQDYSLAAGNPTVYELAQQYNTAALQEHEIKIRLTRFLFTKEDWDKQCFMLSGGQRMRLILCCLTISPQPPDIIILDEPTNNLDIQNINILTAAISDYRGTLLVVSHDARFLDEAGIQKEILLISTAHTR